MVKRSMVTMRELINLVGLLFTDDGGAAVTFCGSKNFTTSFVVIDTLYITIYVLYM